VGEYITFFDAQNAFFDVKTVFYASFSMKNMLFVSSGRIYHFFWGAKTRFLMRKTHILSFFDGKNAFFDEKTALFKQKHGFLMAKQRFLMKKPYF
jgi:hypothetical protein